MYAASHLKLTSIVLATTLALGGCIGGTQTDDTTRTRSEGAIGGALLGALAGQLLGGDTKSTLIGASFGAAAGYIVGNEVAKRKQEYKNAEDLIAGETRRTEETLYQVQKANTSLEQDIRNYRVEISRLNQQVKRDSSKRSELKAQKVKLDKRYASAQEALKGVENELETAQTLYKDTKQSAGTKNKGELATWNKKIRALKAEKVALQRNTQQLQAVSQSIAL